MLTYVRIIYSREGGRGGGVGVGGGGGGGGGGAANGNYLNSLKIQNILIC